MKGRRNNRSSAMRRPSIGGYQGLEQEEIKLQAKLMMTRYRAVSISETPDYQGICRNDSCTVGSVIPCGLEINTTIF